MDQYRFLITARFDKTQFERLKSMTLDVEYAGWGVSRKKLSEYTLKKKLAATDIIISEYEDITRNVLSLATRLMIICCCRNGPEASVDLEAATELGIPVFYTPGRNAVSVTEYTFGLMICAARHIHKVHHLLKYTTELTRVEYEDKPQKKLAVTSEWSLDARAPFTRFAGPELSSKRLGLIGCGAIGKEIARRAKAFNMLISVYDPYVSDAVLFELGARRSELPDLIRETDFLVMTAKVTDETRGMISADMIGLMKPTAFFINTARAALVDYDALYDALAHRRIAGAAIDVYPQEPLSEDNPFLKLDNVVLSPHLAGASSDIEKYHSQMAVDDILQALDGKKPSHFANPEVWMSSRLLRRIKR